MESGSRSHTLLHTTAGEGDIRAEGKKRSREKEETKIGKKGRERRKEDRSLVRKLNKAIERL